MKPPGPISEVEEILEIKRQHNWSTLKYKKFRKLEKKWLNFAYITSKKYKLGDTAYVGWSIWCNWYLAHCKKEKCEEILK